jgi:hypothetical protein
MPLVSRGKTLIVLWKSSVGCPQVICNNLPGFGAHQRTEVCIAHHGQLRWCRLPDPVHG